MQETQETWVWFLGQEDPLEKEMAVYSRNPMDKGAWWATIMVPQRVGRDWVTESE